jgi:dUTPase
MNKGVQIFCMNDKAVAPTKGHETDAGWDISIVGRDFEKSYPTYARYYTRLVVVFNDPTLYGELYARSSTAKLGVCLANGVGIIDPSYRGELLVSLASLENSPKNNLGMPAHYLHNQPFPIRIAQLLIKRRDFTQHLVLEAKMWNEVEKEYQTDRGAGGFGSTGFM